MIFQINDDEQYETSRNHSSTYMGAENDADNTMTSLYEMILSSLALWGERNTSLDSPHKWASHVELFINGFNKFWNKRLSCQRFGTSWR